MLPSVNLFTYTEITMKKLYKNITVHNIVGHPLMEIFYLLGCPMLANLIHDKTLPEQQNPD
tara:strand:+ start:71 stop:253 length:183 start_codon:yes stop_codon:yes gene_type:complete